MTAIQYLTENTFLRGGGGGGGDFKPALFISKFHNGTVKTEYIFYITFLDYKKTCRHSRPSRS